MFAARFVETLTAQAPFALKFLMLPQHAQAVVLKFHLSIAKCFRCFRAWCFHLPNVGGAVVSVLHGTLSHQGCKPDGVDNAAADATHACIVQVCTV